MRRKILENAETDCAQGVHRKCRKALARCQLFRLASLDGTAECRLSPIKLERVCRPLPYLSYSDTSILHLQLLAVSQGWLLD